MDYVQDVVDNWKKMAEESIASRRRRLAEIDTNIALLKAVRQETLKEIARSEGLLGNLVPLSNDLAAAARKEVDSAAVILENDPPGTEQRQQPEVKWHPPNSLGKDSSVRIMRPS